MTNEATAECGGCGSTHSDRVKRARQDAAKYPDEDHTPYVKVCPHCRADKCSMCDMGDDVNCITCDNGCPNDEDDDGD